MMRPLALTRVYRRSITAFTCVLRNDHAEQIGRKATHVWGNLVTLTNNTQDNMTTR